MTENIPQTSASERIEAARKALAVWDNDGRVPGYAESAVAAALRALITPPTVGESEEQIAADATEKLWQVWDHTDFAQVQTIILGAVRSAIQSAHESWEPSDVPSQEFMLRHLGITHADSMFADYPNKLYIPNQYIEKEVI